MAVNSSDCTPQARLAFLSCLSCLSPEELQKAFLLALTEEAGSDYTLPGDAGQLVEDSACWTCLSDKQLLQAQVSAYLEDKAPDITMGELREKLKCLACANPKQIKAAIAMLTCQALAR